MNREGNRKCNSIILIICIYRTSVQLSNSLGNRQSQSEALLFMRMVVVTAVESFKEP